MNILINFVNRPQAIKTNAGIDYRAHVFFSICMYLKRLGHNIYIDLHTRKPKAVDLTPFPNIDKEFIRYSNDMINKMDFWLVSTAHSPNHIQSQDLKKSKIFFREHKKYHYFKKHNTPMTLYDHGWLFESVWTDRQKFLSDSYYTNKLSDILEQEHCPTNQCRIFAQEYIKSNLSKRPQGSRPDKSMPSKYIFVPIQKIQDMSLLSYTETGMIDFLYKVYHFARHHDIPLIIKPHPHAKSDRQEVVTYVSRLQKKYKKIFISDASIYSLMQKALFTACINSGSIVDNFITQTPVYCCGRTMFYKSGALIYNPNVVEGLQQMLDIDYNSERLKLQQTKVLWWLKNNLLFLNLDVKENTRRLAKHSGVTLL